MKKLKAILAVVVAMLLTCAGVLAAPQLQDAETGSAEQSLKVTRPEGRLRGIRLGRLPYRVLVPTSWASEKGTGKLMNANDPKTGTRVWAESPGDMPVSLDEMLGQFAANADFSHVFKVTIGQNSFVHYIAKAENLRGFAFKAGNTLVIIKFTPADSADTTALAEQIMASLEKVKAPKAEAPAAPQAPEAAPAETQKGKTQPDFPWKDAFSWKQIFDLAQAGERYIRVTGTVKRAETEETIAASQEITLKGAGEGATLDGNGLQILKVTGGAETLTKLINLKLMNGVMHGEDASGQGGAVYTDGNLSLDGCTLTANEADRGGAAYAQGSITLNSTKVNDNTASYGGGLCAAGSITLKDSTVTGNSASEMGGGAFAQGDILMAGGEVSGNSSDNNGGGLASFEGRITLKSGEIAENSAAVGGGVFSGGGDISLEGSQIHGNTAQMGGGVFAASGTLSLSGGEVSQNQADMMGGGLMIQDGALNISGGSIKGNTAETGGGVWIDGGGVQMSGGTVEENRASDNGGGIRAGSCDVEMSGGSIRGNQVGDFSCGGGIYVRHGNVKVTGGTVSENTAFCGAGIYAQHGTIEISEPGLVLDSWDDLRP